jgi:uncharacterized protein (DUF1697 family)
MAALQRCLEGAGFAAVKTILASGNVAFDARATAEATLERKLEAAMAQALDRSFYTIVRPSLFLQRLVDTDPYAGLERRADAKRVVTFFRTPPAARPKLPIELDGARIVAVIDREAFTAYTRTPRGPVFMTLIEKTFGTDVTTRTWDTLKRCAAA